MATKTAPKAQTSATMANLQAAADKAKPAAPKVSETPAAVDFASLGQAKVVQYVRVATRTSADREATTPDPVKAKVTEAFQATAIKGEPVSLTLECGTAATAEAFMKSARAYATFKGFTLRGKVLDAKTLNILIQNQVVPATTPTGSVVSYSVKARETRAKLTPEAKAAKAAKAAATRAANKLAKAA